MISFTVLYKLQTEVKISNIFGENIGQGDKHYKESKGVTDAKFKIVVRWRKDSIILGRVIKVF